MPLSGAKLQSLTNCVTGDHSGQLTVNNPHYASAMQILFTISMVGFLWETNGGGSRFLLNGQSLSSDVRKSVQEIAPFAETLLNITPDLKTPKRLYIPVLRRAIRLENGGIIDRDAFETSIRKNYGIDDGHLKIFSCLQLYSELQKSRNATSPILARLRRFESFLSAHFFGGRKLRLVPVPKTHGGQINLVL